MSNKLPDDQEFHLHMVKCIEGFSGDSEKLSNAVGMMYVGRLYGWEHQRVVSPRATWTLATKVFGDPKELLPRRTPIAEKRSRALRLIDAWHDAGKLASGYLDVVRGHFSMSVKDRKAID